MVFARTPEGDILTDALIDNLQRQATHDAEPLIRATAGSIPQNCNDFTFRELTWLGTNTRNAALGAPSACFRLLGETFGKVLEIALCDIAEAYRKIILEGGIDAVLSTAGG